MSRTGGRNTQRIVAFPLRWDLALFLRHQGQDKDSLWVFGGCKCREMALGARGSHGKAVLIDTSSSKLLQGDQILVMDGLGQSPTNLRKRGKKSSPLELAAFGKHFCKQAQGEEWQWKEQMFNECSVT